MANGFWRRVAMAGALCLTISGARAETSLTQRVAPYRARAAKLAAQKKWELALRQISDAKELVRSETRRQVTPPRKKIDPAFYKEMSAVQKELLERAKKEPRDAAHRDRLTAEFAARKAALLKKYHVSDPNKAAAARWGQQLERQAQSALLLASLDETAASYFSGKGDRERATASREDATLTRLRAYVTLKQEPESARAAETLLKMRPSNPQAYAETGRFFQERKQWARAAQIWETVIGKLKSGQVRMRLPDRAGAGEKERGVLLAEAYRQVAFCYQQLGRKQDAQKAMDAALEADRALGRS